MFTARLTALTKVSGQISFSSSSFVRSRPRWRTRHTSVSKTFGVRGNGVPSREMTRSAGSNEKGPNWYISFSVSDIGTSSDFKKIPRKAQRQLDDISRIYVMSARGRDG